MGRLVFFHTDQLRWLDWVLWNLLPRWRPHLTGSWQLSRSWGGRGPSSSHVSLHGPLGLPQSIGAGFQEDDSTEPGRSCIPLHSLNMEVTEHPSCRVMNQLPFKAGPPIDPPLSGRKVKVSWEDLEGMRDTVLAIFGKYNYNLSNSKWRKQTSSSLLSTVFLPKLYCSGDQSPPSGAVGSLERATSRG